MHGIRIVLRFPIGVPNGTRTHDLRSVSLLTPYPLGHIFLDHNNSEFQHS